MSAHAEWCRMMFHSLAEGGAWGVPRSGLIFTRRGDELVLTAQMPWSEEMAAAYTAGRDVPPSEQALVAYQNGDYELIRRQFAAAGITVTREEQGE